MITAVEIENFKGIRERTRIEIKPITLLFGPNSAGKSTLLHALQLAREIFTRRNLDVDITEGGAGFIDLGGFQNYVHGRDLDKVVTLRFDLDLSDANFLQEYSLPDLVIPLPGEGTGEPEYDLSTIGDDVQSGWVEIKLGWRPHKSRPYIAAYSVGLNGEHLATIEAQRDDTSGTALTSYNIWHPLFRWPNEATVEQANGFGFLDYLWPGVLSLSQTMYLKGDSVDASDLAAGEDGEIVKFAEERWFPADRAYRVIQASCQISEKDEKQLFDNVVPRKKDRVLPFNIAVSRLPDSPRIRVHSLHVWEKDYFPENHRLDQLERDALEAISSFCIKKQLESLDVAISPSLRLGDLTDALPELYKRLPFEFPSLLDTADLPDPQPDFLARLLSRLMLVPGRVLRKSLEEFRYVGPVRDAVPRNFDPPRFPDSRRWAGGLAAWDELSRNPQTLAPVVSEWLSRKDRLDTGYGLRVHEYRTVTPDADLAVILESPRQFADMDTDEFKVLLRDLLRALPVTRQLMLFTLDSGTMMHPADLGQGITQAIPVVVAVLHPFHDKAKLRGGLVAIEQPELHLHPAAQVGLGDLFIEAIQILPGQRLLVETHSEHLLLRLLRRIRQTTNGSLPPKQASLSPDQLAVICFEPPTTGGSSRVYLLGVDDQGEFLDPWPRGFFDERAEELFGQ